MRFLPKSRASMDQAPGPTIANVAPRNPSMTGIQGSPKCEKYPSKAIHTLTMATSAPATGVHRPTRRSIPAPTPMICRITGINGDASRRLATPKWMSATLVSNRRSRRPMPGQPSANVENSRCNPHLFKRMRFATVSKHTKLGTDYPLFWGSTVQ
jgi:hypothetical protein